MSTRVEPLTRLHSDGRLLSLLVNIRLGWERMVLANALGYYNLATITYVKVKVHRPACTIKLLTAVFLAVSQ
jgi:hypothetical protein